MYSDEVEDYYIRFGKGKWIRLLKEALSFDWWKCING
jgi:hypothetical protein